MREERQPALSATRRWKYVKVRRWFIFIEDSIDQEPRWVVFDANGDPEWSSAQPT